MAAPTTTRPLGSQPIRSKKKRELPFPLNLYQTSVGKKWVMALTGAMLMGFVFAHMIGNLKLYLGQVEHNGVLDWDMDHYAESLRELFVPIFPHGTVLWLLRIGLIGAFGLHIHSAYSLSITNRQSNKAYASKRDWQAANWASRTTRYTGTIILLYLVFHLADFTWGWLDSDWEHGQVQANVVNSLERPLVAIIYIIANIALAIHLYHGARSMFQTLGVNNPRYNQLREYFAYGFAALILVGNLSFPIAVLTGLVDANA